MSVGEWLNSVIAHNDEEDFTDDKRLAERLRNVSGHRRDRFEAEAPPRGAPYRGQYRNESEPRPPPREGRPPRKRQREQEREASRSDAARSREEFGEVHARLDRLSQQLERLSEQPDTRPAGAPAQRRSNPAESSMSIDDAVAEIAARQRALDGDSGAPPASSAAREPILDFSGLERQLRQITSRIESLQPTGDIEKAIGAIRTDLADIGHQLNEALPRRAVESLEIEVKALAERIDHSRESGVDPTSLAGLERGLTEVREALRGLTPAESLVGFDQAVNALAQKVDMILARDDPAALQQLEAAIAGLRGVVSHVASNDTLTRVAEDVRTLAAQVDGIANNAATGQAVSVLEQRIDTLTAALNASSEAGHAVPRDLEKLLAGLIEKLEWVQLTHTDHAALAHLEDRIATLVKRFDASDARLGHLEAIERGLADLLVHIEQMRGINGGATAANRLAPPARSIERDVAEIKQTERRTQDSLEAVQETVEHVVDRIATIESDLHGDPTPRVTQAAPSRPAPEPAPSPAAAEPSAPAAASPPPAAVAQAQPAASRAVATRPPIDPTLPPDHPLEPGSAAVRSRPMPSAADRVAASEAAIGSAKPPVISDSGRPDFIAAARRAAQAAAWEPSGKEEKEDSAEVSPPGPNKLSQRLHKLIVAGSAVLILIGALRVATRLFDDSGPGSAPPQVQSDPTPPTTSAPQATVPASRPSSEVVPLPQPHPGPAPSTTPITKPAKPGRQSLLPGDERTFAFETAMPPIADKPASTALPSWASPDITGALPAPQTNQHPAPSTAALTERPAAVVEDKLPATIGDPALRKAALAGDPAAEYEVATRFADGRGVPQNNEQAVYWLQLAAKQGLAPAQFRLGGLYEKGLGVRKDLATARDLYLAAAQKGHGKAMHNLAVLYAEGVNGAPDYNKAAEWFRQAANRGIRDSQYNLAILYARGIGVEHNDAESYKWFAIAAAQGDAEAAKKRDEIAAQLDPQSLAAAKLAVQNWAPEPQPDDAINVKTPAAWELPRKPTPRVAKSP
jgi:localization factor PodJL